MKQITIIAMLAMMAGISNGDINFTETFDNAAWAAIKDPNSNQSLRFDAANYLPGTVATNPATYHGVELEGSGGSTGWEWMVGTGGADPNSHRGHLVNDKVNGGDLDNSDAGFVPGDPGYESVTMNGTSYFSFFRNTGIMLNLTALGLDTSKPVNLSFDWVHGYDAKNQTLHYGIIDGQAASTLAYNGIDAIDLGGSYGSVFAPDEVLGLGTETKTGLDLSAATGDVYLVFMNQGNIRAPAFDNITVDQIPEPATLGLVATLGGAMLFIRRRTMM